MIILRAQVRNTLSKDEAWIQKYIVKVRDMWQLQSTSTSEFNLTVTLESVLMLPLTTSLQVPSQPGFYELSSGQQSDSSHAPGATLVGMFPIFSGAHVSRKMEGRDWGAN